MNPRERLKHVLLRDPQRRILIGNVAAVCEGQGWLRHECIGGWEMSEVLYPRNDFSMLPPRLQAYFWNERNCAILCSWFHQEHGHTRDFRAWMAGRLVRLYGYNAVEEFLAEAPLRCRTTLEALILAEI